MKRWSKFKIFNSRYSLKRLYSEKQQFRVELWVLRGVVTKTFRTSLKTRKNMIRIKFCPYSIRKLQHRFQTKTFRWTFPLRQYPLKVFIKRRNAVVKDTDLGRVPPYLNSFTPFYMVRLLDGNSEHVANV